ncbi:acetate--CoA ligase [Streptomyces sp. NPDC046805]|uniref:acetate--CoA ligase n=1 Tax=Streptomyces sp. NPDC046805 TaxID=3155134 RepID=UPI0033C78575
MISPTHQQTYDRSIAEPEAFWRDAARAVDWIEPPSTILDATHRRWFPDGVLNTCFNALDRHVRAGRGDKTALIHDSAMTGAQREYSYAELTTLVAKFAGVLRSLGVERGDRVLIYLPMVPEALVAMLACARIGAVHSVVFGGFAAAELAARISDARPKVVVAASCGLEPGRVVEYKPLLDQALDACDHQPDTCVIVQRPQAVADLGARDLDYASLMASEEIPEADCVALAATDPLYILYTSGTTGRPKGVVRDHGGHAVALSWSMMHVYDVGPDDVMFTASDIGWVVGHSYIVYGPLLAGATTVLYEGKPVGTPDAGAFWRLVEQYGVNTLFTAPTALRAIKRLDPEGEHRARYDLSSLRNLFLAGERLDPATYDWAGEVVGVPVTDHWWQTETGWPVTASLRGLDGPPGRPASSGLPVPGFEVHILDDDGRPLPVREEGAVCLRLPLPPGTLTGLWNDEQRFVSSYLSQYEGYYLTGDGGFVDEDGYVYILGRTDDVMNVAGHRLSSGQIEAAVASHPAVAEAAVIGARHELKGQVPHAFVVTRTDYAGSDQDLATELSALVRRDVGPIATLSRVDVVNGLPKTRSGKVLRKTMRQLVDGEAAPVPSTIEDISVLDDFRAALAQRAVPSATPRDKE